jgi:hypothetical protein
MAHWLSLPDVTAPGMLRKQQATFARRIREAAKPAKSVFDIEQFATDLGKCRRACGWRAITRFSLGHLDSTPFWFGLGPARSWYLLVGPLKYASHYSWNVKKKG